MDTFNGAIDFVLGLIFRLFSWSPGLGLALISAASGVGMLWMFRKGSNQERIRIVKRQVQAHLMELRIYGDEPAVVWKALKDLLVSNLRYMGLMLRPAVLMALPFAILLVHLEAFYGRAPLPVGADTTVTLALRGPMDQRAPTPVLEAPPGVAVETPAVRVLDEGQVSWRIRAGAMVSSRLRVRWRNEVVDTAMEAGAGPRFVPGRRVSSLLESVWNPDEPRIGSLDVDWLQIRYPDATLRWLGIRMHWLLWFLAISMLAALLLKKRFGVVM